MLGAKQTCKVASPMSGSIDKQDTRGKLPRTPKGNGTRPDTVFSGPQRGFYSDVATVGASQKLGVSYPSS